MLGDEFYYVPNGRVPTSTQGTAPIPQEVTVTDGADATDCTDGQFTDGQNTNATGANEKRNEASLNEVDDIDPMDYLNRKHRRRKSRTKQLIEIPQPVLIGPYPGNSRKIVFIPGTRIFAFMIDIVDFRTSSTKEKSRSSTSIQSRNNK